MQLNKKLYAKLFRRNDYLVSIKNITDKVSYLAYVTISKAVDVIYGLRRLKTDHETVKFL